MKKNIGNILFFVFCGLALFIIGCQAGLIPLRFIYLKSGSMMPTYQPGDLALVYFSNNIDVKPRDVVLFTANIGPTIHRAVSIENGLITTKGDANNMVDDQKIYKVDGKVLFMIPKLGYAINYVQQLINSLVTSLG